MSDRRGMAALRRPSTRLAAIAVGVAALACAPGAEDPAPRNLLLVTVDTLRHDRLGYAGHDRPTSDAVDALAARGVRFERAYSQSGWTLPSLASILTGLHPSQHGAVDFESALASGLPTLATRLADAGYDTRAFVSHVLLRPRYGLARGFAAYDDSVLDVGHPHRVATARPLTAAAIAALREMDSPFFLWVHYFDPHFLYMRHPEWSGFGDTDLDRYDGEIAHTDREIGRLLTALREAGHEDDTVVVFSADHGEQFGERGRRFHDNLDEPVARIPLVIAAPGLAPGVRRDVAQQIDLLPTLLALLDVAPPAALPGRDLFDGATDEPVVFMERTDPSPYRQRAVVDGRHKLVIVTKMEGRELPADRPKGVSVEAGAFLYDLEADPGETANLFDESDETAQRLLALLQSHFEQEGAERHGVEVDDELRARLEALGYVP